MESPGYVNTLIEMASSDPDPMDRIIAKLPAPFIILWSIVPTLLVCLRNPAAVTIWIALVSASSGAVIFAFWFYRISKQAARLDAIERTRHPIYSHMSFKWRVIAAVGTGTFFGGIYAAIAYAGASLVALLILGTSILSASVVPSHINQPSIGPETQDPRPDQNRTSSDPVEYGGWCEKISPCRQGLECIDNICLPPRK